MDRTLSTINEPKSRYFSYSIVVGNTIHIINLNRAGLQVMTLFSRPSLISPGRGGNRPILPAIAGKSLMIFLTTAVVLPASEVTPSQQKLNIPQQIRTVINDNCIDCHGTDKQKGFVRFDKTNELSKEAVIDLMGKVQEQLYLHHMPPKSEKPLAADALASLNNWARETIKMYEGVDISDKLRYPDHGNWIDHEQLFSGKITEKPYTPARRWLVSPQIFYERAVAVFHLDQRQRRNLNRISNPFILTDRSGVRDYDLGTLDGGHFFAMRANAEWMSAKLIRGARVKAGEIKADEFENKADKWYPKNTQPEFEIIILKKTAPTDEEMIAAIQTQFDNVLQRPANDSELARYLVLTRKAIELAGNTEGQRQMLAAVLLESEFVYRLEFGAGKPDAYGRKMLSPREASYAIAYALGDKIPDPALVAAVKENRLNSKADYEREVKRLLADDKLLYGQVDESISQKSYSSTQPKIIRFFREFFGYYTAPRVFKDVNRSDGFYQNAGRGTYGTAGDLADEADMLVDYYYKLDRNVFENLIGGELYFVAPVDNAEEKIKSLNLVYEKFKDRDWKKIPAKPPKDFKFLNEEEEKFLGKHLNYRAGARDLRIAMIHIEKFREKNLTPNPVYNYAFGTNLMKWVNAYSINPFEWEYAVKQPFPVDHRRGLLMHPAWLIAHSQNSATDIVRRGKWVREKLLAGIIPDVPITVDARIPEDPHKTLRERLELVSGKKECWKCHEAMNPLGVTFEAFDDFGRYRTEESLEYPENLIQKTKTKYGADTYKTKPLNLRGVLDGTDDPKLDGDVTDALDLVSRLQKSDRARQSIIRHAFRFFLGRNEMLSDSQTLIDADNAYVKSGGSFNAVIVSLLTSDSFMYRK